MMCHSKPASWMVIPSLCLAAAAWCGCARVKPLGDYQRTTSLVLERTGAEEAYDPALDAMIDDKVGKLLADGATVEEAVSIALLRNRGFQSLFSTIGASRADVVQSTLLTNPAVNFSARFPEGGGRSDLTLNFAQELVDLWQIPVRKKVAEAQLEQTVLAVVQRGVELAADVRSACYRLLALQRSEQMTHENLELVERSLKLAQDRFTAGETGQLDVNLVRASLIEVQLNLIAVQRDLQVAKASLAREMGLSRWSAPWELKDSLETGAMLIPEDDSLMLFGMQERLDAQAAVRAVDQAEGEVKRQYLSVFSHVTLGVEGERGDLRAMPGRQILADTARASVRSGTLTAPQIQTRGERNLARRQIIDSVLGPTLSVTLPIWDQNQAQIAKAAFKVEEKRKAYEDLLDLVAGQVQEAAAKARTGAELAKFFAEHSLPIAQENVAVAQRAYQAGEQNIVALIDAQRFLISQRLASINVLRDYAVAVTELRRVLGGRLPEAPAAHRPATTQGSE